MVNKILKEINNGNWFILFQWQMEDSKLCFLFRRVSSPNFVIFVSGYEESRVYGEAQVEIASFEKFIKENDIEQKWVEFKAKNNGSVEKLNNPTSLMADGGWGVQPHHEEEKDNYLL